MSEHCCRISSTTWFWNTMVMGMLASSVSGRSSVGPNTMATLCTDMRFCSPYSITLQQGWGGGGSGPRDGRVWGGSPFPWPAAHSPAQMLEEQPHGVVVGGGQRVHQAAHKAAALGLVLQLWRREGWARRGERMERTPAVWGSCPRQARCTPPPPSAPLTDGRDELAEVREGEEGLGQLSKEELQGAGDHVHVLPASVLQVQTLICSKGRRGGERPFVPCLRAWAGLRASLTVVHLVAQLLDGGQVSTDAVQPVDVQPWREEALSPGFAGRGSSPCYGSVEGAPGPFLSTLRPPRGLRGCQTP